jgi:hypothetical protein
MYIGYQDVLHSERKWLYSWFDSYPHFKLSYINPFLLLEYVQLQSYFSQWKGLFSPVLQLCLIHQLQANHLLHYLSFNKVNLLKFQKVYFIKV